MIMLKLIIAIQHSKYFYLLSVLIYVHTHTYISLYYISVSVKMGTDPLYPHHFPNSFYR